MNNNKNNLRSTLCSSNSKGILALQMVGNQRPSKNIFELKETSGLKISRNDMKQSLIYEN